MSDTTATGDGPRMRAIRLLGSVGLWTSLTGGVMVVAYLIGSLILTGGQVGEETNPNYEQIMPFPVFEPPVWLTVGLAAVGLLTFVPMAALLRPSETARTVTALRFTAGGNCIPPLLYMWAFPDYLEQDSWLEPVTSVPSAHWVALAIGIATYMLTLAASWRAMRTRDRDLKRSREAAA